MKHFHDEWIDEWCCANGWTELFVERPNNYWAFPPGAAIPQPIPPQILRTIKSQKGMSYEEQFWSSSAFVITGVAGGISIFCLNPMPLVFAFVFAAITVAKLEVEFP